MLDALAGSDKLFVYTSGTGVLSKTGTAIAYKDTVPAPQAGGGKRVEGSSRDRSVAVGRSRNPLG
jgi:hypothetical protein